MTTDYAALKTEVDEYLAGLGVTAIIALRGDACPPHCEDKGKPGIGIFPRGSHIHGQHYELTLTRGVRHMSVDYWNSYAEACVPAALKMVFKMVFGHTSVGALDHVLKVIGVNPDTPSIKLTAILRKKLKENEVRAADVLGCCTLQEPGTFEDFCGDYGYDNDSRKAYGIYEVTRKQYADFTRMFTPDELEQLAGKVREL